MVKPDLPLLRVSAAHGRRRRATARLTAALDGVLLDLEAANPCEIDWLVVGVIASGAKRLQVLRPRPALEDIHPAGIHRVGRHREVKTSGCLAGETHRVGTRGNVGVSVRRIKDEVAGDNQHAPIVPRAAGEVPPCQRDLATRFPSAAVAAGGRAAVAACGRSAVAAGTLHDLVGAIEMDLDLGPVGLGDGGLKA